MLEDPATGVRADAAPPPVIRAFDSIGRTVGLLACLAAATSAAVSAPVTLTAGLAVIGAIGVLVTRPRERRLGSGRSPAALLEDWCSATDARHLAELVQPELRAVVGRDLSWCVITSVVPSEPLSLPPAVERDLRRALARARVVDATPMRILLPTADAIVAPCGAGMGQVLVVAAREIPVEADARVAEVARLAGMALRHASLDAKLNEQRESSRFEELVRFSSDAIFIVDAGGVVRYAAPSVTTVLGHLSVDVVGRPLADLVVPEQAADIHTFLANVQLQDARHPNSVALRFERADGTRIDGEITGANLLDNSDVRGIVATVRDVSSRVELEEQLRHQAFHDGLTGLANRALFRDRLDRAMRVRRDPTDLAPAVAFIDLDDFKTINDSLGHGAGDALLQTVADRIQGCLRGADTAARLGGDEFAILLEDIPDEHALDDLIQRVVDAVAAPIMIGNDHVVTTTASAGVATSTPDVRTSEDLLRHADMAMYRAKLRGKDQLARYESTMHQELHDRLELTADLDAAVRDGGLAVHYQPVVDLASGAVVAAEALVRWPHPTRGMLRPDVFLAIAEESGLIVPLGDYVLRRALDDLQAWRAAGRDDLVLSVNVSPRQFLHDDFERSLFGALDERGLPTSCLLIEITEAALGTDPAAAEERLRRLADTGVRIVLDDYGTGRSSLRALQELPFAQLKIDRSFVSTIRDGGDVGMARTIVDLAKVLGADAVAEGIETPEDLEALRRLGCVLGQGHLFGEASPSVELGTTLGSACA